MQVCSLCCTGLVYGLYKSPDLRQIIGVATQANGLPDGTPGFALPITSEQSKFNRC